MKTLRFIGMAIVAIIMSVNFVACSDDDDDIDVSQLEGTWGLVHDTGWEESDGDKDSWDDTHTPNNPCCMDCSKSAFGTSSSGFSPSVVSGLR